MSFPTGVIPDESTIVFVESVPGQKIVFHRGDDSVVKLRGARLVAGSVEVDGICGDSQANHFWVAGRIEFNVVRSAWSKTVYSGVSHVEVSDFKSGHCFLLRSLSKTCSDGKWIGSDRSRPYEFRK